MFEIVRAIVVATVVLTHVIALGGVFLFLTRWWPEDRWTRFALLIGLGLALFGGEVFLIGEAKLLNRGIMLASTFICAAIIRILYSRWTARCGAPPLRASRNVDTSDSVMGLATVVVFALTLLACTHPPRSEDEIDYHWPAPLLWARSGGWVASPYRRTGGPVLAEMLFTVAALERSTTAAHFIGVMFLSLTVASCASLARAVGAPPRSAVIAALSIEALLALGPISGNDVAAAAFGLCAYAALLADSTGPPTRRSVLAACILLAAAVSTKPFMVLVVPGACALILDFGFRSPLPGARRQALYHVTAVALSIVATFLIWAAHSYAHTHKMWDSEGYLIARNPTDPLWNSYAANGRTPRPIDFLNPLLFPLRMTIGREDSFAGFRIGPLLLVFVPIGLLAMRRMLPTARRLLYWLIASALFYLVVFSPVSPRTRFHLFVWCIGAVVAAIGFAWTQTRRKWIAQLSLAAFMLLFSIGALDACRHIFSFGMNLLQRWKS